MNRNIPDICCHKKKKNLLSRKEKELYFVPENCTSGIKVSPILLLMDLRLSFPNSFRIFTSKEKQTIVYNVKFLNCVSEKIKKKVFTKPRTKNENFDSCVFMENITI